MITILLEKIITILEGWIQSFTSHAQHVEDKLDSLDQTASDIKTNTDPISDIADNTRAVITPIQNIKSNTDSIKQSSQTSANNTTAILNNVGTLSTNTGRAAAFAQDCANNTLDIKNKVTTIASDTTDIRTTGDNIYDSINDIKDTLQYFFLTNIVTEDSEGVICNFDTDLEDYLQKLKVSIPADPTGFSGLTLTKKGKNLLDSSLYYQQSVNQLILGQTTNTNNYDLFFKKGTYTVSCSISKTVFLYYKNSNGTVVNLGASDATRTFTLSDDTLLNFYVYTTQGILPSDISWIQIECNESNSAYEPYKAMTYPVSFGSTITDGAEVDLLEGIAKINTSPVTYLSFQPIAIRTYKGVNNIYSDIGTSALTYRETLKHYLDKNNQ